MTREKFYGLVQSALLLFYHQVIRRDDRQQYLLTLNQTASNSNNNISQADLLLFIFDCHKNLNTCFGSDYPFRDPNSFSTALNAFSGTAIPKFNVLEITLNSQTFWFWIQDNEEITPETRASLAKHLTILSIADVELGIQAAKLSNENDIRLFKKKFTNELIRLGLVQRDHPPIQVNNNKFFRQVDNQSAAEKFHELLTPVSGVILFGGIALGLILVLGAIPFSMHGMAAATLACCVAAVVITFLAFTLPLIGLGVDAALNPHHYNPLR